MSLVQWSKMFETGVSEIDDQHRRLIGYINELDSLRGTTNLGALREVLEGTIDYTLYHFAFEECLMESTGYKLSDAHKRVHDLFAKDLQDLRARFESGQMSANELNEKLSQWLFDHIRNADTAAMRDNHR